MPGRVVSSAKSWLCSVGVDPTASMLPWNAPDDVAKVSALDAATAYLRHLHAAWDAAIARKGVDL